MAQKKKIQEFKVVVDDHQRPSDMGLDDIVDAKKLALYWGMSLKNVYAYIIKLDIQTVDSRKTAKREFWFREANHKLLAYLMSQNANLTKPKAEPEKKEKDERVDRLEQEKIRQLVIKNRIAEKSWAPIEALEVAIDGHNASIRSIVASIKPKLKRKYSDKAPVDMLEDIEADLNKIITSICELRLDPNDFKDDESEDPV